MLQTCSLSTFCPDEDGTHHSLAPANPLEGSAAQLPGSEEQQGRSGNGYSLRVEQSPARKLPDDCVEPEETRSQAWLQAAQVSKCRQAGGIRSARLVRSDLDLPENALNKMPVPQALTTLDAEASLAMRGSPPRPPSWEEGVAKPPVACVMVEAPMHSITRWLYRPCNGKMVDIRCAPAITAPTVGRRLLVGEAFDVSLEKPGVGGEVTFLQLADGRGWVFDHLPGVGSMCVRANSNEVGNSGPTTNEELQLSTPVGVLERLEEGEERPLRRGAEAVATLTKGEHSVVQQRKCSCTVS